MGNSCCGECCEPTVIEVSEYGPILGNRRQFESYTEAPGAPTDKKWYHAAISDREAEHRLKVGSQGNKNSYLVYDNPRKRDEYILLVINRERFYRWRISKRTSDNKYILGNDAPGVEGFDSVRELIKAHRGFRGRPIKTDGGQSLTLSRSYVYCDT